MTHPSFFLSFAFATIVSVSAAVGAQNVPLNAQSSWSSGVYWNTEDPVTLYNRQDFDPDDTLTEFTGDGRAVISEGVLTLEGDAPRYRVLEPMFTNVSVSFDAMRVSEERFLPYAGFVVGVRSQHYGDSTCGANTYYASLTYNGNVGFEKELFHGEGNNAFYPGFNGRSENVFDNGVPFDQWINLNFTVVTDEDDNAVLTLAVDGEEVLDFTDDGSWSVDSEGANENCEGYYPENKIIQSPGFVFIRNDGLGEARYKNLEIVEVS